MAAVARSQQRDAGVEALLARISSGKEASAPPSDDDEVGGALLPKRPAADVEIGPPCIC